MLPNGPAVQVSAASATVAAMPRAVPAGGRQTRAGQAHETFIESAIFPY